MRRLDRLCREKGMTRSSLVRGAILRAAGGFQLNRSERLHAAALSGASRSRFLQLRALRKSGRSAATADDVLAAIAASLDVGGNDPAEVAAAVEQLPPERALAVLAEVMRTLLAVADGDPLPTSNPER